jgi:hypothetical protein
LPDNCRRGGEVFDEDNLACDVLDTADAGGRCWSCPKSGWKLSQEAGENARMMPRPPFAEADTPSPSEHSGVG